MCSHKRRVLYLYNGGTKSMVNLSSVTQARLNQVGGLDTTYVRVSGDYIFYTLQGEGPSIGVPAVFLRTQGCNLRCKFSESECDSSYTWNPDVEGFRESRSCSAYDLIKEISRYDCHLLVITGGEPMLQQLALIKLIKGLDAIGKITRIEIETNASIPVTAAFEEMMNATSIDICFNCSPKLENSGNDLRSSINPDALGWFCNQPHAIFKFVAANPFDLELVDKFLSCVPLIDKHHVFIMPEGVTIETLQNNMKSMAEHIKNRGWRLAPRLQFYIWGNTRRT